MSETADIVIVGAGVIGLCATLSIARRSRLKVVLLDKGEGPGEGSTGASSAVCRFRYSRPEMVALARDGIAGYRAWSDYLGVDKPHGVYQRHGNVWLGLTPDDYEGEVERMTALGVRTAYLDDDGLGELFPALNRCVRQPDFETGEAHACAGGGRHFYEFDSGYMEPGDVLTDLLEACRALGVSVRFKSAVRDVETVAGSVSGVRLEAGERIGAGVVVNATGPWCARLMASAGLDNPWPLVPTRIQIVQIDRPDGLDGDIPICADPASGIYFRPARGGDQIVVGSLLEEDEQERVGDPDDFLRLADDHFMSEKLFALEHRLGRLDYSKAIVGYSGLYTINTADVHPVVGPTPLSGFYVANGFSGHGFKLAPAIGRLLAAQITGEAGSGDPDIDPAFLAFGRTPIRMQSKSVLA
ncbi:MAG: FAD-dependent oxidoreductase [Oceanicaulis sp.]